MGNQKKQDGKNQKIVVIVVVVVIIAIALYLYGSGGDSDIQSSKVNSDNIGSEIFDEIEEGSEVLDKAVPDTNPFNEAQNTNPFSGYKNPFGN